MWTQLDLCVDIFYKYLQVVVSSQRNKIEILYPLPTYFCSFFNKSSQKNIKRSQTNHNLTGGLVHELVFVLYRMLRHKQRLGQTSRFYRIGILKHGTAKQSRKYRSCIHSYFKQCVYVYVRVCVGGSETPPSQRKQRLFFDERA